MKAGEVKFLDYLSAEEQNLLTSIINFRSEFDLFYNLDRIYQEPLRRLEVSEDNSLVPELYLFVHFHLYFSVSCLLRSHLSECLSSIRKGIDATLSAYKMILEPQTSEKYLNRDPMFQQIKNNMQREIKEDPSKYPLAHRLIEIHGDYSEYGSHADISSFVHRLEVKGIPGTKKDQVLLHYFQFPRQTEEYQFYFIVTLQAFFLMFMIFKVYFDTNLRITDPQWEGVIKALGQKLQELGKRYSSQIQE